MFTRLKINIVIATMVALCLSSAVTDDSSAQSSTPAAAAQVAHAPDFASPISQRAGALAINLMLVRIQSTTNAHNHTLAKIDPVSKEAERKRTRITGEIEMPFFSFGGLSGVE